MGEVTETLAWRLFREEIFRETRIEVHRESTLNILQARFGPDSTEGMSPILDTISDVKFLETLQLLSVRCADVDEFRAKLSWHDDPNMVSERPTNPR